MADKPCPHLVAPLTTPSLLGDAYFPARATLQEIFGSPSDAAAVGLALSQTQLNCSQPLFWVQEDKVLKLAQLFLEDVFQHSPLLPNNGMVQAGQKLEI